MSPRLVCGAELRYRFVLQQLTDCDRAIVVGSVMTKLGLFKDERDTVKRRIQHKDGRCWLEVLVLPLGLAGVTVKQNSTSSKRHVLTKAIARLRMRLHR